MFLNILVAIDGSPSSMRAVEQAVDLARSENSKLTLITVAPTVDRFLPLAGVSPTAMKAELERWAADTLAQAAASMPADVGAHRIQLYGDPGERIVEELERGGYDLIVLGSRGLGRTREILLGSVNGYVHFHSRVAILSVHETD
jgi:nucleotide-binding universal stress UspA family protein